MMARSLLVNRITAVWALLVGATVLSWAVNHGLDLGDVRYANAALIVIAFIKVRFVILDFMEIRGAPRLMRVIGEAWVVVACCALVTLCWQGGGGLIQ
jgi:succinate-acetate transporter protein